MNAFKTLSSCCLSLAIGADQASAQFTFSIDWKGPTIAQAASVTANVITEADILTFGPGSPDFGPLATPAFALSGSQLGLVQYNACQGHLPGTPCGIEVDAISQGLDEFIPLSLPGMDERLWFSTDEWAQGLPMPHPFASVRTESGLVGDVSADVFMRVGGLGPPLGPGAGPGVHVAVFDGNGLISAAPANHRYPGIGLEEPNVPNGNLPNGGDNLDALDLGAMNGFPSGGYYISLDGSFNDPLSTNNNSSTAQIQGFSGGDVLRVSAPANAPAVFASANSLGLDLVGGVDSDDLDALILWENGTGFFEPSQIPFDWVGGRTDMLLFSVRRGSSVIGQPDSFFGQPIEAGDVLTTPRPANFGGVSSFPAILYSAESLGLRTMRSHGAFRGDDLDGMDISSSTCFDCNNNGVEDAVDIATGSSSDDNDNGIPDECENITEYCHCNLDVSPCGNDDPEAGCRNTEGLGAHLFFQGTHSVAADDLMLVTENIPADNFGLYYMGSTQIEFVFGGGLRCVGAGNAGIFRYAPASAGSAGVLQEGPGIVALSCQRFPAAGCISPGSTWNFQCWYRDPGGLCNAEFNTSNAISVQFAP